MMGKRLGVPSLILLALVGIGPSCGGGSKTSSSPPASSGPLLLLKDIRTRQASSSAKNLCVVGNTVFFAATEGAHGEELWKTDGTPAGTTMVKDLRPGSLGSNPRNLTAVGSTLFF